MKTGEVAKILGVDAITVRRWIERDELKPFFSGGARGEHGAAQRLLTESDVMVLNTIRALRTGETAVEWHEIAAHLDTGERVRQFPQNAISADPRMIPFPQAEQSARAMATMAERDAALARVDELSDELDAARRRIGEIERERDTVKEALLREMAEKDRQRSQEIAELSRQIGKLEGLLEALRSKGE